MKIDDEKNLPTMGTKSWCYMIKRNENLVSNLDNNLYLVSKCFINVLEKQKQILNPLELISSSIGSRVGNYAYLYKFGHIHLYFMEKKKTGYFRG